MASFGPQTAYEGWAQPIGRAVYWLKGIHRMVRVTRPVIRLLGPQYVRSRDLIEIDITYACNLRCFNCNRSCRQAPSDESMDVSQIEAFLGETERRGERWSRVRVLGGEPCLHDEVLAILRVLVERLGGQGTLIELATNGFGPRVHRVLADLPSGVDVDNSHKTGPQNDLLRPFNSAPVDHWFHRRAASYRNGCQIAEICGMGFTPFGYYFCAVAGGIDRVAGLGLGRPCLPDEDDDMLDQAERLCGLCGRFLDGHFIPHNLRKPLRGEVMTPTWRRLYAEFAEHPPRLSRYGEEPGAPEPSDRGYPG